MVNKKKFNEKSIMKQIQWLLISALLLLLLKHTHAQDNRTAPLGINLGGIASWSEAYVFVDVMKCSRPWIAQLPGQPWGEGGAISTDSLGWVTTLAPNQYVETPMLDGVTNKPTGDYVLLFEGEGTFDFGGDVSGTTLTEPGRILVHVSEGESGIWLRIIETDPNETGNYLRNIRLIMPGFEAVYQTAPFHPMFLERWQAFSTLRFMDWQHTNNNPNQTWNERTTIQHQTQARASGVALEYCIQLANTLQTDAWFCLPHQADDNYITQFATMIRDNIDPDLKVIIEYSNEVWNGQFEQANYASTQGLTLGLSDNSWEARPLYYAQRSVEIFNIFESIFDGLDRLERVLAWQNFNYNGAAQVMDHNNAYQSADALAIAPYFGGSYGSPDTQDAVAAFTPNQLMDYLEEELAYNMDGVARQAANAHSRGLRLIAYEGGQHLVGTNGAENNIPLMELFHEVNRSDRMKDLYMEYYQRWKLAGGELLAVFSSMGAPSKWGSWGILENYTQVPMEVPKYAATIQFMECNNPAWWINPNTTPSVPLGEQLINFQGAELGTTSVNQSFTISTDGTHMLIPFSTNTGDHLFNCTDYTQGEFYGGINISWEEPITYYHYLLNGWSGQEFLLTTGGGEDTYSRMDGIFLWKKEQFLNGYNTQENVSIGNLTINISDNASGPLRFVVKNSDTYYISDFLTQNEGTYTLDLFNNSSEPAKRWRTFNPTANDFFITSPLTNFEAVKFNDVTEVGFVVKSERAGYSHSFAFDSFQVYTLNNEELSVTLNQSTTQAEPTPNEPIQFTAVFSHAVNDFDSSDVVLSGSGGAASTVVQEIAPFNGTNYQIDVSDLSITGNVIANIPAGVAHNTDGYPNLAATSTDHVVWFNGANRPNVSINQSASQQDPSLAPVINFTAIFSEGVYGLSPNNISISGTANATTASINEIAPFDGTTYNIAICGMQTEGTVVVQLNENIAFTNSYDLGNFAASSTDNEVYFLAQLPDQARLINFQGYNVLDASNNRSFTLSTDGLIASIPFSMADGDYFFTTNDSQSEFYGGFQFNFEEAGVSQNFQLRTNDTGFAPNRFWAQAAAGEGIGSRMDALFMWRKDQFLNNMNLANVGFDDTDNSRLAVNLIVGNDITLRFIVKNDGVYYISEHVATSTGLIELTAFNNNSNMGYRWAVFTPISDSFAMPSSFAPFTAVDFTNVEEVGFLYKGERNGYSNALEFDAFEVDGVAIQPYTLVQSAVYLEGFYNANIQAMNTQLRANNLLPITQPFNTAPWNYTGTESLNSINEMPYSVVDWVLLEARNPSDNFDIVAQKAALLLSNGNIVDADFQTNGVKFYNLVTDANYFISVKSRNHIGVISEMPISLPNTVNTFIFNEFNVNGGISQLKNIDDDRVALLAGDYNADGVIVVGDFNGYIAESSIINQYLNADFNGDGIISIADFNLYQPNASAIGVPQIRY